MEKASDIKGFDPDEAGGGGLLEAGGGATVLKSLASRTAALIPVLNEEEAVGDVVGRLLQQGLGWVIVIDNGSTDGSAAVAARAGAEVVYEKQRGYGAACWTGMQALPAECDAVLFAAGDGQDDVSQLPTLLQALQQNDLAMGDRTATASSRKWLTIPQRIGSRLASTLMFLGWGSHYNDLGAFRLIRRSTLEALEMQDRGFGWTVEMQVKAAQPWRQVRVAEVPVEYRPRLKGQSKISGTIKVVPPACEALRSHWGWGKGTFYVGSIILMTIGQLYLQELGEMVMHPVRWPPGGTQPVPCRWEQAREREQQNWQGLPRFRQRLAFAAAAFLIYGALLMSLNNDLNEAGARLKFCLAGGLLASGYLCLLGVPVLPPSLLWTVSWALRLLLLVSAHVAGDDVFRFVWEGWLNLQGLSPYEYAPNSPQAVVIVNMAHTPYMNQVRSSCNNPSTTSIYPPLAQIVFSGIVYFAPRVQHFKIFITAVDMLVTWLLSRQFGAKRAALYGWNPLVLMAGASGGHYDSLVVLPMVVGWFAHERGRWKLASFLVGVSAGLKWVSAPVLGFIAVAQGEWIEILLSAAAAIRASWSAHGSAPRELWLKSWGSAKRSVVTACTVFLLGVSPLAISAIPFCSPAFCRLVPASSSWARSARRNAFIPALATMIYPREGRALHNIWFLVMYIPVLLVLFLLLASRRKEARQQSFARFGELFFFSLLAFSPVVHFWYFTWGLPFGSGTGTAAHKVATVTVFLSFLPILFPTAPVNLIQLIGMWLPIILSLFSFGRFGLRQHATSTSHTIEAGRASSGGGQLPLTVDTQTPGVAAPQLHRL